jgi:DNA-binding CsgD family transcriptional regulator
MTEGYASLSEKEKETLRLIVQGHDAKSAARQLGLSIHTVNERLRDARRKLSVSSSREAARIVLATEAATPQFLVDKSFGDAEPAPGMRPGKGQATRWRLAWIVGGVLIMSLILAFLAMHALSPATSTASSAKPRPAVQLDAATTAEATRAARAWLALVDHERWDESWQQSGLQFRRANTSAAWAAISKTVRPPLGAVMSREVYSQEAVPAPPHGYVLIKFLTRFANKPAGIETVSLEREGRDWKVVGYWIA